MTKQQAEEILRKPVFCDPKCIAAMKRLEQEPAIENYRRMVVGRKITCGPCGGSPRQVGGCDVCGSTGMVTITAEWAATWDLEILQGVAVELGQKYA